MKSPREVLIDAAGNAAVSCGRALNGDPIVWQEFLRLAAAAITARDAEHQETPSATLEVLERIYSARHSDMCPALYRQPCGDECAVGIAAAFLGKPAEGTRP